jgi:hypothetical protein
MGIGLGTCIIALKTADRIIIAADSRRRFPSEGRYEDICKIIQVGSIFFASSGLSLALDTGFDIQEICKEAINAAGNVSQSLQRLEEIIIEPLREAFEYSKKDDLAYYESTVKDNPVTVAFFGIQEGSPILSARKFYPVDTDNGIDIRITRVDDVTDGTTIHMGCPMAWDIALWNRRAPDPVKDPIGSMRAALQAQIDDQSHLEEKERQIAGPISIIEVDSNGARWIDQGVCPDIEQF